MLENMRKSGASVFIWLIFGTLIAVFVINFGPKGGGAGCSGGGVRTALTVGSDKVDDSGFRMAVNIASGLVPNADDATRYEVAFEMLIRRELLAQEAEHRGLRVSESLVDHVISRGELHFAGESRDQFRQVFMNEEDVFDYKRFKRFLQNWGLSVGAYKRQQTREVLATLMSRILSGSVPASREEALAQFVASRTTVAFEAVRFDPQAYADAMLLTEADIDRFAQTHEAEVKAAYSDKLFKNKKQVHLRRIKLAKTLAATPKPAAADAAKTDAANSPSTTPDPARARLEALRATVVSRREPFGAVARINDVDDQLRLLDGSLGWHDEASPTLSDPKLSDAAKALVSSTDNLAVSEVIETDDGFYLLAIDDRRSGDLTFDQVKRELAEPLARRTWSQEAARRAAISALEAARAATGKKLSDLYPAAKTGQLTWESQDIPAMWAEDEPVPAPGAAPSPSGAPAADAPTPAAPAAEKPAQVMTPSADQLPRFAAVAAPSAENFGPLSRSRQTPLGESDDLNRALFDQLTNGMLAPTIFEIRETKTAPSPKYVLVQLTEKNLADMAEFEKQADMYVAALAKQRGDEFLRSWLANQCTSLVARGELKPAAELLRRNDEQGRPLPVSYRPCMTLLPPPKS